MRVLALCVKDRWSPYLGLSTTILSENLFVIDVCMFCSVFLSRLILWILKKFVVSWLLCELSGPKHQLLSNRIINYFDCIIRLLIRSLLVLWLCNYYRARHFYGLFVSIKKKLLHIFTSITDWNLGQFGNFGCCPAGEPSETAVLPTILKSSIMTQFV